MFRSRYEASVVDTRTNMETGEEEVKIHFRGFGPKFDVWFVRSSRKLRPSPLTLKPRNRHLSIKQQQRVAKQVKLPTTKDQPRGGKREWTDGEVAALVDLVRRDGIGAWELKAAKLGSDRTPSALIGKFKTLQQSVPELQALQDEHDAIRQQQVWQEQAEHDASIDDGDSNHNNDEEEQEEQRWVQEQEQEQAHGEQAQAQQTQAQAQTQVQVQVQAQQMQAQAQAQTQNHGLVQKKRRRTNATLDQKKEHGKGEGRTPRTAQGMLEEGGEGVAKRHRIHVSSASTANVTPCIIAYQFWVPLHPPPETSHFCIDEDAYRTFVARVAKHLGSLHLDTITAQMNLAILLKCNAERCGTNNTKAFAEARSLHMQVVQVRTDRLGASHADTLIAKVHLMYPRGHLVGIHPAQRCSGAFH